jgi:hypothetical protein
MALLATLFAVVLHGVLAFVVTGGMQDRIRIALGGGGGSVFSRREKCCW